MESSKLLPVSAEASPWLLRAETRDRGFDPLNGREHSTLGAVEMELTCLEDAASPVLPLRRGRPRAGPLSLSLLAIQLVLYILLPHLSTFVPDCTFIALSGPPRMPTV